VISHSNSLQERKNAIISGGTSGVGLSIAKNLIASNYKVVLIGSNGPKGKRIEASLNEQYPKQVEFVQLDLSNLRDTKEFTTDFISKNAKLDLLVNTAGIFSQKRIVTNEGFEKTFAVGYLSAYLLSTQLAGILEKAAYGRIANVAGIKSMIMKKKLDFDDISFSKNYSMINTAITTIHAKTVLTEILAEKYANQGIDVNSFHPGAVKSDLTKNLVWWQRMLFLIPELFFGKESTTGIFVSSSPTLNKVTGKYFIKKEPIKLNFEKGYKQKLQEQTEQLLAKI
jgi:NAD(P)-dependent dehydrogenase (short-subunit alcohol dehydrogenase family)